MYLGCNKDFIAQVFLIRRGRKIKRKEAKQFASEFHRTE
jgi:hypothetical protein